MFRIHVDRFFFVPSPFIWSHIFPFSSSWPNSFRPMLHGFYALEKRSIHHHFFSHPVSSWTLAGRQVVRCSLDRLTRSRPPLIFPFNLIHDAITLVFCRAATRTILSVSKWIRKLAHDNRTSAAPSWVKEGFACHTIARTVAMLLYLSYFWHLPEKSSCHCDGSCKKN